MILIPKLRGFSAAWIAALILGFALNAIAGTIPAGEKFVAGNISSEGKLPEMCASATCLNIVRTLEADLARKGDLNGAPVDPREFILQSTLLPALVGAGLEIKRVRMDPYRREIIFEIWAPLAPTIPPVEIAVRESSQLMEAYAAELAARSEILSTDVARGESSKLRIRPKPAMLAKPGTPATLTMFNPNLRITMEVLPLQSGAAGQTIFVRDPASGRVLKAEVVGENTVQANF